MNAEDQKTQWLPYMVKPVQMGMLVSQNKAFFLLAQGRRQIDHRPEDPENKGARHLIADTDIAALPQRDRYFSPEQQGADDRI